MKFLGEKSYYSNPGKNTIKRYLGPDMLTHCYDPSTWEAKTGGSLVQGQPWIT
jgi:hypothetical protein